MLAHRRSSRRFHRLPSLSRAIVVVLCVIACPGAALAGAFHDPLTNSWFWVRKSWKTGKLVYNSIGVLDLLVVAPPPSPATVGPGPAAARPGLIPADIRNAVHQFDSSSFTVESGEPLAYPTTKRTGWRLFVADRTGRVVVSTYGSTRFGTPLDTTIGVYRKKPDGSGERIARNDNLAVAGGYGRASFVAFDAVKGASYAFQLGDVGSEGGDMLLTSFSFGGSAGGLVVQPTSPYDGYDFSCTRNIGQSGGCLPKDYVVYNATKGALHVTVSATGLDGPVIFPKTFTLKPGAAALKTIAFGDGFGADGEALSGGFAFTGKSGGEVVARTIVPARVAVHDVTAAAATLKIASRAQTVAVTQSAVVRQILEVSNVGAVAARSCYVRRGLNETLLQTAWAGYDAERDAVSSEPNTPFDIAPGKSASIVVAMRALRDRLADPGYERPLEIGCASGPSFPSLGPDLTNVLDFTATVTSFADVSLVATSPKSGVFQIARRGSVMTATFRNDGEASVKLTAKALERTIYEFGSPKRYKVSICPAKLSDAACLASDAATLDVTARPGKVFAVKVAVKPPAEDPGYSPNLIGVALSLNQPYSDTFPTPIPVSGVTKALKVR